MACVLASPASASAATGPYLVKDLRADSASNPRDLVAVGNRVFFTADDGLTGRELYVSDGTFNGTRRVKDIWAGKGSANPVGLIAFGDKLAFLAKDGVNGQGVYVTDGTSSGTMRIARRLFCSTEDATLGVANGVLYFERVDLNVGCNLYASDGSVSGTHIVATRIPGFMLPTAYAGKLYFAAHPPNCGCLDVALYKTASTATNGFKRVARFGSLSQMLVAGKYLYLVANDNLWRSTGTASSLHLVTGPSGTPIVAGRVEYLGGGVLLMSAGLSVNDSWADKGLWRTDGTTAGTKLLLALNSDDVGYGPGDEHVSGGELFFSSSRPDPSDTNVGLSTMWRSDGTSAATLAMFDNIGADITNVGEKIFSQGCVDGWSNCVGPMVTMTDTGATAPVNLGDVYNVSSLTATSSMLFFTGTTPGNSGELYAYIP
jgi:ELWxxDGT repeat protein